MNASLSYFEKYKLGMIDWRGRVEGNLFRLTSPKQQREIGPAAIQTWVVNEPCFAGKIYGAFGSGRTRERFTFIYINVSTPD